MPDFALLDELATYIEREQIQRSEQVLIKRLEKAKGDAFKDLPGLDFTNSPDDLYQRIQEFIAEMNKDFKVRAIHLEMNDFSVNPEEWFFDLFAYDTYDDEDDEWLSDWQSPDVDPVILTGLEPIQEEFQAIGTPVPEEHEERYDIAEPLVAIKFLKLVQSVVKPGSKRFDIPVLATCHDFQDLLVRFDHR